MKKLQLLAFARLLPALVVGLGLPALADGQTADRKIPDLVILSVAGKDLFEFYCASCHGRDGKGNGPVAPALKAPPPDLTTLAQQNRGRFPAARVEGVLKGEVRLSTPAHGPSDMPVWGPIFRGLDNRDEVNDRRIENLVKYIESMQAKARAAGPARHGPGRRPMASTNEGDQCATATSRVAISSRAGTPCGNSATFITPSPWRLNSS